MSREAAVLTPSCYTAPGTTTAESEIELMAGNLPVPQGVEVKLVWQVNGVDTGLNILHGSHQIGTVHSQARADAISTAIKNAVTSSGLGAQLHTTVGLARVESRHMDSNEDPWYIGAGAATAGTGAGTITPLQLSACLTIGTGKRGRSFNGRFYQFGYITTAIATDGKMTAATKTNLEAFLNAIHAAMAGGSILINMGVLSRWTTPPSAPPNTPPTERQPPIITPATSYVVKDLVWDTQRRRAKPGI